MCTYPKCFFFVMKRSVMWIILCLGPNLTNGKPTQGKKIPHQETRLFATFYLAVLNFYIFYTGLERNQTYSFFPSCFHDWGIEIYIIFIL